MNRRNEISTDQLTDQVIRRIKDMIWKAEVLPGDYLPSQHDLAEQFGVGISTVREAIKALSLIGLVDAHAGRGTRVLPDALKILNDSTSMKANLRTIKTEHVLEARVAIEGTLARLAAERASQEDITDIEIAMNEMRQSIDDDPAFVRADMHFHLAVARASQNEVLLQTYTLIRSLLEEVVREADNLPGGKERAIANHNLILEGIKTHDYSLTQTATERQVNDLIESMKVR